MKRPSLIFLSSIFMLFLLVFFPGPTRAQEEEPLKHPREMNFPPLSFSPPKATRTVLSNGMILYLLEDPELPLVNISALIRTGSIYDPPDKVGLAH